jgi:DNA (cytosine-5)-methyltransferase 1
MDNTGESRATVLALRMRGGKPGGGKGPLIKENMSQCLATGNDQVLFTPAVRRLTPRECERLQGWPDDHTRWASDGKEISDSARYKMTGNGISSPVSYWLCSQLIQLF